MPLSGKVQNAAPGIRGCDTDTVLKNATAQALRTAGYMFCARYLSCATPEQPGDLCAAEAAVILGAGMALIAVQHVPPCLPGQKAWVASAALGKTYGQCAATNAKQIGLPPGMNIWADLEQIDLSTPAQAVIDYCNNWFAQVAAAGYIPALYVGADAILTADQLYAALNTKHYWRSGSPSTPDVTKRGYQMVQHIDGTIVGTVQIDTDFTSTDALGDSVLWLAPA
jgi:hypothetical protein